MPDTIQVSGNRVDLSGRIADSTTVVASPAAAAETIICSLALPAFNQAAVISKVFLDGWAAFTVGTNGTAIQLKIRQTNVSGTVIVASGALTGGIAAAALVAQDIQGSDASPGVGTYVLTLQVTGGSAASTVSAVSLRALVV